jgi:hypothetical protein
VHKTLILRAKPGGLNAIPYRKFFDKNRRNVRVPTLTEFLGRHELLTLNSEISRFESSEKIRFSQEFRFRSRPEWLKKEKIKVFQVSKIIGLMASSCEGIFSHTQC